MTKKIVTKIGFLAAVLSLFLPFFASAQTASERLVKVAGDPTVYIVAANGTKRPVASEDIFNSSGLSFRRVSTINQTALNQYPQTVIIKVAGSPAIYRLNPDMSKQLIASWQAFLDLGFQPRDITIVTPAEMGAYNKGPDITSGAGRNTSFEQGLNSRSQSMIAAGLADNVNIGTLGSSLSSRPKNDAASTLANLFPSTAVFTFMSAKDVRQLTPAAMTLQERIILERFAGYTAGYTGKDQRGDRAGLIYRVNSSGMVDQVVYANSLCAVGEPFYQCQR